MDETAEPSRLSGGITRVFVEHRLLGWLLMAAVLVWGWFAYTSLPQQEDPTFPRHDAVLVTVFPGADAATIEEKVTAPLEKAMLGLPTMDTVHSFSRPQVSVLALDLEADSKEVIEGHWEKAREILAGVELPEGCHEPKLDTEFQVPATLLLAVHGKDRAALESTADLLAEDLGKLSRTGRIRQFGNAPEAITRFEDMATAAYTAKLLHREGADAFATSPAVLVAVEMKGGSIIRDFKSEVLDHITTLARPAGVEVTVVSDQPKATAQRIGQFLKCFIEAVLVVVVVALLLMDWRTALVVAVAIPLTLAMTLGGMALLDVPLQQISIAALILALGMLVDDPVVASDGINRELANGHPPGVASWLGPYRLRRAIFFGTLINIVAFLPLALLPGDIGAFILSLPIVITLTLVSSRIVSMTFIPLLGYYLLKGQRGFETGGEVRKFPLFKPVDLFLRALIPRYQAALASALRRPLVFVLGAYGLLAASFLLLPYFGKQFFPPAERNQLLIDIQLPEGSPIEKTREVTARIGELLKQEEAIDTAVLVSGGGAPMFYYNILPRQTSPHLGQILVNTHHADEVPDLVPRLRETLDREIDGALVVVKEIIQGPAMEASIMVEVTGEDRVEKAAKVSQALRDAGGYKVHDDSGVIARLNGERTITVKALAPSGELASRILKEAKPSMPTEGIAFGGEERELTNSQREMKRVLLISLVFISLAMVVQFRSLSKSLVVMLTVPLGLIGAFAGLAATHSSFGFMALIGLVSLAGVIVSHIIVLSDFIEEEHAAGVPLEEALMRAALVRLRAVLATVFATVCGLIPLALSGGELWRPLTAVHIFGLLFATLLTLVLLPVLYCLFVKWRLIRW